ncbi:MAG: gluconate 2-dehydrogenase subunit 3 family protein [Bacillota bacterium]
MEIEPTLLKVLRAAAGRIVQPADPQPVGDWKADLAWIILKQLDQTPPEQGQAFLLGLESLSNESWAIFGYPFPKLPGSQQDELLTRVENVSVRTQWQQPPKEFITQLVTLSDEAARRIENGEVVDRPADLPDADDEQLSPE